MDYKNHIDEIIKFCEGNLKTAEPGDKRNATRKDLEMLYKAVLGFEELEYKKAKDMREDLNEGIRQDCEKAKIEIERERAEIERTKIEIERERIAVEMNRLENECKIAEGTAQLETKKFKWDLIKIGATGLVSVLVGVGLVAAQENGMIRGLNLNLVQNMFPRNR
jgi:hypothetical protein